MPFPAKMRTVPGHWQIWEGALEDEPNFPRFQGDFQEYGQI